MYYRHAELEEKLKTQKEEYEEKLRKSEKRFEVQNSSHAKIFLDTYCNATYLESCPLTIMDYDIV